MLKSIEKGLHMACEVIPCELLGITKFVASIHDKFF